MIAACPLSAQTVEINGVPTQPLNHSTSQPSKVPYVQLIDLKGKIPDRDLLAALDDNQDGVIDSAVWAQIQADVQTEIDGILGQRYTTPFLDPLPSLVKYAAQILAIEAVYSHRNLLNEKSPERINAANLRKKLIAIADGIEPLAPGKERDRPSGSAITEPSRTSSNRPAI
jgi:phage gp36-like protein